MKQRFISIFILILLSSCSSIAPAPTATALVVSTNTPLPTEPPTSAPTQTPAPTQNPALEYQKIEEEYIATLSPEQKALYEQYNSKDMTAEGFTRKFLTESDLAGYLAYYDKDGEVAYVWNGETKKLNPAFLVGNNLLLNENTETKMIPNPEHPNLDLAEERQLFKDYMIYVRANACALAENVNLPNTLSEAITDPDALKYLDKGCRITLRGDTGGVIPNKFNYPSQNISIEGSTGIVIKFVKEPNSSMWFSGNNERTTGISYGQQEGQALIIKYYHKGEENLNNFPKFKHMILAERIGRIVQHMFNRINPASDLDTITQNSIYNEMVGGIEPPLIYIK